MSEYAFEGVTQPSSTIRWSFAATTLPADAGFPFSAAIPPVLQPVIQQAFADWAAVAGLTFVQVPDAPDVAIRIGLGTFLSDLTVGETDLRRAAAGSLAPDTVIRLLDPAAQSLIFDGTTWRYPAIGVTLLQVALHEIGHALGLDHTTDPATIMYPVATPLNQSLALGDIEGINALYPLYTVQALNPVQIDSVSAATTFSFAITRYGDPRSPLQLDDAVIGQADPAVPGSIAAAPADFAGGVLPHGQITFPAGVSTVTISVTLGSAPGSDLGFALAITAADGTPVTVRGDTQAVLLGEANDSIALGAENVYRFFNETDGTHFYTASQQERNVLIQTRPDLAYEGIAFPALAAPGADAAAVPIYRFFDTVHGTHFYTASLAERDAVLAGRPDLVPEGTAFYADPTPVSGDLPVYRFFDAAKGTHFYTASDGERAAILAANTNLQDEGVGFYVPSAA